jgi:dTDP-glucose 4,6-dehydratase
MRASLYCEISTLKLKERNIGGNFQFVKQFYKMKKKILITGGAGFIGSHVTRLFVVKYPNYDIYNLDALTYAGNLENLRDIESQPNYFFIKADITDETAISSLFETYRFDSVIHLAAESHVDRSIKNPLAFAKTNILGTMNLLNAFKNVWSND